MLLYLIKYRKFIAIGLLILSAFGALFYYGHTKYKQGEDAAQRACNAQKQEVINENINIKKKQDAVIRSDDAAYINSLRNGSF